MWSEAEMSVRKSSVDVAEKVTVKPCGGLSVKSFGVSEPPVRWSPAHRWWWSSEKLWWVHLLGFGFGFFHLTTQKEAWHLWLPAAPCGPLYSLFGCQLQTVSDDHFLRLEKRLHRRTPTFQLGPCPPVLTPPCRR